MSRAEATGRRLSPWLHTFRTRVRPRRSKDRTRRCRASGLGPKAVSAPAQSAATFAYPAAISAGASMTARICWEAAGFPIVWLA